jgi:hypothetical protein
LAALGIIFFFGELAHVFNLKSVFKRCRQEIRVGAVTEGSNFAVVCGKKSHDLLCTGRNDPSGFRSNVLPLLGTRGLHKQNIIADALQIDRCNHL